MIWIRPQDIPTAKGPIDGRLPVWSEIMRPLYRGADALETDGPPNTSGRNSVF
jgi:hypothetical protein